ncbi:hypothetical protein ACWC0C_17015 [Streptomyces sp. NPDC001709]
MGGRHHRRPSGLDDTGQLDDTPIRFPAVLQVHGVNGAPDVLDAAALWTGAGTVHEAVGPRARADVLLALRRAAAPPTPGRR